MTTLDGSIAALRSGLGFLRAAAARARASCTIARARRSRA